MRSARTCILAISLAMLASLVGVLPGSADHNWSTYCGSGYGLLWVFEDEDFGGSQDHDCNSDSEWGSNNASHINNFHDRMTSFHASDRSGDGNKLCVRMFENEDMGGSSTVASGDPIANGVEYQDPNIGGTWNDRIDSHTTYGTSGSTC